MDKENIKSTNKKFPKFKRAVGEKPGLILQTRNIQIIRLVYEDVSDYYGKYIGTLKV